MAEVKSRTQGSRPRPKTQKNPILLLLFFDINIFAAKVLTEYKRYKLHS